MNDLNKTRLIRFIKSKHFFFFVVVNRVQWKNIYFFYRFMSYRNNNVFFILRF